MIPDLLRDEQKRSRILNAKELLKMFPKYSKKSFNNSVTGDEIWVYYFEPKRKCSRTTKYCLKTAQGQENIVCNFL